MEKIVDTNLRLIARTLNALKKGYSPVILVVGKKGIGKSFMACWLGYTLMKALGKDFDVKRNCVYDLEQAIRLIDSTEKEVIILDEMIELGYRREHYKKSHIHFTKILNTQRIKMMIYIMVIPFASDIDRSFSKHIDAMVYVKKRGVAITYIMPKSPVDFTMEDSKRKPVEKFTLNKSDLSKKLWTEYEDYSTDMKKKVNERINAEIKKQSVLPLLDNTADRIFEKLDEVYI